MEYKGCVISKGEMVSAAGVTVKGYFIRADTWSTICDSVETAKRVIDERERRK